MKIILKMLPYLLICEISFLSIVLIGADTGGLVFLLFIAIPVVCFICSLIYGLLNRFEKFQLVFPLFISILFAITFYFSFIEHVWIYPMAFGVIALIGNIIGYSINMIRKRTK